MFVAVVSIAVVTNITNHFCLACWLIRCGRTINVGHPGGSPELGYVLSFTNLDQKMTSKRAQQNQELSKLETLTIMAEHHLSWH